MTILTFNWHEAYICMLAKIGHDLEVVERFKGGSAVWFYETRPFPTNARIVKAATARRRARARHYDAVICHNLQDLRWAAELPVPKILLFHNMLTTEIALGGHTVDREQYRLEVKRLVEETDDLRLVFISETKRRDWGLDGSVILPGVDPDDYGGYDGSDPRVLRVGNFMRRRDLMLGYSTQQAILGDRPSTLLGLNEPDTGARFTTSWDDLKACFRSHRLFLNTTVDGFEDGYNLAMLEAMATGMPVVSTANRTSPLRDGVDGFVSGDCAYLADRLDDLLGDRRRARALGAQARATVVREFDMARFVARWSGVLDHCGRARRAWRGVFPAAPSRSPSPSPLRPSRRKRILLAYVSYPATIARCLESSLRKAHDVITMGPAIDEAIIRGWNLEGMPEAVRRHDVPTGFELDVREVLDRLPTGWEPDLFLWVESVHGYFPSNVPRLGCPTACYLIDSHLNLPWHVEWATRFDHVFLAQRAYRADVLRAGVPHVEWLPLACDPEVHGRQEVRVRYDVGFVGSVTEHHASRKQRLDRLARRFDLHVERSFLRDKARTMSASKIVFNDAVRNDLNMRVFESLASGSLLLTDRAPGSGLDEMFVDREHLVIYDDDTLEDLVASYLGRDAEREAIAERGREEVLRWHTYDHRARALVDAIFAEQDDHAIDERWLDEVIDPLVQDGVSLANRGQPAAALARFELLDDRRDLSPKERLLTGTTRAACLRALGRESAARRASLAAVRALPRAHQAALFELV